MSFSVVLSAVLTRRKNNTDDICVVATLRQMSLVIYFVKLVLTTHPRALVVIHFRSIIRFCVTAELDILCFSLILSKAVC